MWLSRVTFFLSHRRTLFSRVLQSKKSDMVPLSAATANVNMDPKKTCNLESYLEWSARLRLLVSNEILLVMYLVHIFLFISLDTFCLCINDEKYMSCMIRFQPTFCLLGLGNFSFFSFFFYILFYHLLSNKIFYLLYIYMYVCVCVCVYFVTISNGKLWTILYYRTLEPNCVRYIV